MDIQKKALELLGCGFNCSQSVLEAYAYANDTDTKMMRKLAAPFAGGAALGGRCGAVDGAIMAIGLACGKTVPEDTEADALMFNKTREFAAAFKARNGHLNCADLLGCDIFAENGQRHARESALFQKRCPKYVSDAVEILQEIL